MKMKLLPLVTSVSLILASTLAHAQGPINGKVYGKINATFENQNISTRTTTVQSNASRFGFKGDTDLKNGLSAIYQVEYGINLHSAPTGKQTISQRDTFVGVKGNFGSIFGGIISTPLKNAQGKVDLFNDLDGDFSKVMNGEDRKSDTIYYKTPNFGGISLDAAYIGNTAKGNNNGKNGTSVAVKFNRDNIYAALAYNNNVTTKGGLITGHLIRLVGSYSVKNLTVGGLFEQSSPKNAKKENSIMVNTAYKLGTNKLKVEFAKSDIIQMGSKQFSIGADHNLGKKTKTFLFFTKLTADGGISDKYAALGLEHKF